MLYTCIHMSMLTVTLLVEKNQKSEWGHWEYPWAHAHLWHTICFQGTHVTAKQDDLTVARWHPPHSAGVDCAPALPILPTLQPSPPGKSNHLLSSPTQMPPCSGSHSWKSLSSHLFILLYCDTNEVTAPTPEQTTLPAPYTQGCPQMWVKHSWLAFRFSRC